ncbi:hypothetical protein, partial [Xanthomonas sacchari]|uniref:hypothetical protein n=1 Tax=Xanthomonas sacchari TaxID=56458 RepID=UPI00225B2C7E
ARATARHASRLHGGATSAWNMPRSTHQLTETNPEHSNTTANTASATIAARADVAVAVAVAVARDVAFKTSRLKASRAPEWRAAEEAPLFERSEFGRRAARREERRGPVRPYRTGSCQAGAVLVTFAKTKVTRARRRESL